MSGYSDSPRRGLGAGFCVAALSGLLMAAIAAAPVHAQRSGRDVARVNEEITLAIPEGWSQLENGYKNMVELVAVPGEKQQGTDGVFPARLRVFLEPRLDHQEAVGRLAEIAVEWEGERRFLVIGGWPALERRYDLPVPQIGERAGGPQAISPSLTTAIAYDVTLVRVEGHVDPKGDPRLLDVIAKAAQGIRFARKGDPERSKKMLEEAERREKAFAEARELAAGAGAGSTGSGATSPGASPGHGGDIEHLHLLLDERYARLREIWGELTLFPDTTNTIDDPVLAVAGGAEISVAVSEDGDDIVVATNGGFSFSNDGGQTFNAGGGTPGPNNSVDGDPSVTWGDSDTFYYGFIGFPNGTPAWNNQTGCSTGISASTDGGQTFPFVANATFCPNGGANVCFPDQEHIAADRTNAAAGGDQVYSVWRNFTPVAGANPATCLLGQGIATASIVCSQDSAANWTATAVIGAGDFPRVTVGSDGFVYVAMRSGGNIMLNKFSSCANGLNQQAGFPVTVSAFNMVQCPVAGLDRCNNGNILSSPTVAVSDEDPDDVFVAFATNTAAGNENVQVHMSTNGGSSFSRVRTVNTGVTAQRFMPWVCSENGRAFVTYYDRRNATAANNDLTGFFLGEAIPGRFGLFLGTEIDLTGGVSDPQCASGWPCNVRNQNDSESCAVQPQNAGVCLNPAGGGSNARCDFSNGCPNPAEVCFTGGGCPKYGDYNYSACANGRIITAWSSATPPAGIAGAVPAGINTYVQVVDAGSGSRCKPWTCVDPVIMDRNRLVLECAVLGCAVFDPVPLNCQRKWECPGCEPGFLCPPPYEMRFEGFTPDEWEISIIDVDGYPVDFDHHWDGRSHTVRFQPDKRLFREGQIGDYVLVFTLGPEGVPGKRYEVKTEVERVREKEKQ